MRTNWLTYTSETDYDCVESTLWIRGYQLFPYLRERGIECLLNGPPDAAPVAVVLRWQDERAYEAARAVKAHGGKVVFDLCVNYLDATGMLPGGYGVTELQVKQCRRMLTLADHVTCASATIASRMQKEHREVSYIPDSVDMRHFNRVKPLDSCRGRFLRVAWSGVASKASDLNRLFPCLVRNRCALTVSAEADPFGGRLARRIWMKGLLRYRYVPWHYGTFPDVIAGADICVSPRDVANTYDQGHSFFKIGVFMAEGVPAIASPVPSYLELIGAGKGGWACRTPLEWNAALAEARRDPVRLGQRSAEARMIMQEYTTERIAAQWDGLLAGLASN